LRRAEDQQHRLISAIDIPEVRILAHPRGRITGSRAGIVADWDAVFAAGARRGVAIEIDGDPAGQDVSYTAVIDRLLAWTSDPCQERRS
jgi:histidinol phosphatase-like PHP family hydrolase